MDPLRPAPAPGRASRLRSRGPTITDVTGRRRSATVPALALVPLRWFLGGSFLYAGFDKLLDARFFDPTSPASIQSQMLVFARVSPIGDIVRLGEPFAIAIGIGIAVAEIAIGLGALTGLAFRAAATLGAVLAVLFFLTASWSTHPFYYGPDLPFAAGWITLAISGHGGVFVANRLIDSVTSRSASASRRATRASPPAADRTAARGIGAAMTNRRDLLQAGLLAVLAVFAASLSVPFRAVAGPSEPGGAGDRSTGPDASPGPNGSTGAGDTPPPGSGLGASPSAPTDVGSGIAIGTVADVRRSGAKTFTVPFTAPAPLPGGDPGVVVLLADGSFVAFDATCTHAGCRVEWDRQDRVLVCPCHGAVFDPGAGGAVLDGPTNEPLARLPITVDAATGQIRLRT